MTLRNITCAVTLCLLTLSGQAVGKTEVPPYKNKSLSIEKRVDDLMGRMTLREKVLQLQNRGAGRLDEIDRIFNGESYGCTHEMGTTAAECAAMYKELTVHADENKARNPHYYFCRRHSGNPAK